MDSDTQLKKIIKVLKTVDGIGSITIVQLYTFFPELGHLNSKQIANARVRYFHKNKGQIA